ncbi:hypothetical protein JQC91_17415 [Jannaschia sp. Os4]|uniref:hypothetical protein n=1 Tax=Jannaschia sp. Os4 TaxID=2807617 RepID=UPI00193946B0|nr:hypothetical protein [Jannaschia sp. Os4]MBM2578089.1 hypothetical protein [Jannaschia sp. Os4]
MLTVDALLTPDVRDALRHARARAYADKADAFARERLPQRLGALAPADRRAVVEEAYRRGRGLGLEADGDQLMHLVAVAHLGIGFATDPQFAGMRAAVGWRKGTVPDLTGFAGEIDRYRDAVAGDVADLRRPIRAFELHFARDAADESDAACLDLMGRAFPARTARLSAGARQAVVAAGRDGARTLGLGGADMVAHVALTLCFGHAFGHDPLHPWAGAAYAHGTPEARRLALGAGVRDHVARFVPAPGEADPSERF